MTQKQDCFHMLHVYSVNAIQTTYSAYYNSEVLQPKVPQLNQNISVPTRFILCGLNAAGTGFLFLSLNSSKF